jgi:hypothetical protein
MLSYHSLRQNPRVLRACTSLAPAEFETRLIPLAQGGKISVTAQDRQRPARQQRAGGGRKPRLVAIDDKWLCMLFSVKGYPRQAVLAFCFGMSQGRANAWLHKLRPILASALGEAHCCPERDPQSLEQVLARCASVDFLIDGTERPGQRPTAPSEQQEQSSGKKKAYSEKYSHRGCRRASGALWE